MDLKLLLNPVLQRRSTAATNNKATSSLVSTTGGTRSFLPVLQSSNFIPSLPAFSKCITEFTYNDLKHYNYSSSLSSSSSSTSSCLSTSSSLLSLSSNCSKSLCSSSMSSVSSTRNSSITSANFEPNILMENNCDSVHLAVASANATHANTNNNFLDNKLDHSLATLPSSGSNTIPVKVENGSPISISKEFKLARRRYYTPKNSATEIQKRTGSCRPQGRPFSGKLAGNFVMHKGINELIGNLFNKETLRCFILQDLKTIDNTINFGISHANIQCFQNTDNDSKGVKFKVSKQLVLQPGNDVERTICDSFNCSKFKFVQVMRSSEGKILKIESKKFTSSNDQKSMDYKWVKQNVIYPRYKANMKINLVRLDDDNELDNNFAIYTDLKMLILDLKTKPNKEIFFLNYKIILILDSRYMFSNITTSHAGNNENLTKLQVNYQQLQKDKMLIVEMLKSEFAESMNSS